MAAMKAVQIHAPGGPSALKLTTLPIPTPRAGQVLIRIRAFGLNRSEMFTRQGHSGPAVPFPRVLGIEATGTVASCPGGEVAQGETVLTCMGGMGRVFDGGYAEYCVVEASNVQTVKTQLSWEILGALPEMMQTAYGAVFRGLGLKKGERFLVRGGTTSVGLTAIALAKNAGAFVGASTRASHREALLKEYGADEVVIDDGSIAKKLPEKYDRVLELVGTTTLLDSLQCVKEGGSVCMTGIVGNKWDLDNFSPMAAIPPMTSLTTYSGGPRDFMSTPMQKLVDEVEAGHLKVRVGKVFKIEEIVEAHRVMEENTAGGKIVVLT